MKPLRLVGPLLICFTALFANAEEVAADEGRLWANASLTSRLLAGGVQASLGVRELLGAGIDVRFDLAYLPFVVTMPAPGAPPAPLPLIFEVGANALGYTSRPALNASAFALVAYGGAGPRLLALLDTPAAGAILGAGALGGLELRYAQFGLFLEGEASLPLLGLNPEGIAFGPVLVPIPKLTFGLSYYF